MTPERPDQPEAQNRDEARDGERSPGSDADGTYSLYVFASDHFPASPEAARRSLRASPAADAGLPLARFEWAIRAAPEIKRLRPWVAPVQRLNGGLHLRLDRGLAHEAVLAVEAIARRHGLAVLDDGLDEISFPCVLGAREHIVDATRALCDAGAGYLMIEGGPNDRYFVQAFFEGECREICIEAVSNRALAGKWKLPRSCAGELRRQGWRPPRGAGLNYSVVLPVETADPASRLTTLFHDALTLAYGVPVTGRVTICLSLG